MTNDPWAQNAFFAVFQSFIYFYVYRVPQLKLAMLRLINNCRYTDERTNNDATAYIADILFYYKTKMTLDRFTEGHIFEFRH